MRREASYSGKWGVNSPASRNFAAYNNITTYKGTSSKAPVNLSWTRGNMLGGGNLSGKEFEYKYGPDNLRYSKKVGGTETIYYWDGDILMGEKTGNNITQYLYDASGIVGMIYNKNYYYFEKNLYGDVLRVYNSSGGLAASFTYDSYGNQLSASGSMADKVHFRYRGYYYDAETGFYYLQSRYYDPSICRFISADQYELVGTLSDVVGQLNLYAYCNNNPIMYTDESGESFSLALFIVGVIVNASYGALSAYINGENIFVGAVIGGIVGGITAGFGFGFWLTGVTNTFGNIIKDYINYGQFNINKALFSGFISAAFGKISGEIMRAVPNDYVSQITASYILSLTFGSLDLGIDLVPIPEWKGAYIDESGKNSVSVSRGDIYKNYKVKVYDRGNNREVYMKRIYFLHKIFT